MDIRKGNKNSKLSKIMTGLALVAAISALSACKRTSDEAGLGLQASQLATLNNVVDARDEATRARDQYRNPAQTIAFFQIKPGMSVAEALPGGGWYSNILANYIGSDGELHGINYVDDMWARFGFFSPERIEERIASTKAFPQTVAKYTDNGIKSSGFTFDTVPDELVGSLDRVVFIRALHNLNRFEAQANTMTNALKAAHTLLKEDGMVGVVQHRAPEANSDEWSDGSRGYLKQSSLIKTFEDAGFTLVASSEINANPKDQPTENDIVWRLPPSLNGARDDEAKRAAMEAIGESDRMTLLFKKS
ncbi:class I SAM-dependent methyltransferase [Glaciecola sp. KUL10]|uniref:class I SAM-dependent methyltransferase n=1 Tax=Glaciecola sp. (strain KUL10) TaxID=2161813 RepID=UPI000D789D22|nr:class I SAM-dependent methyltransferase [Glaciecola sp. KUL10]GBL06196.1 O-methyltransferase [Glaciecola sp. KUL10]